jgi:large subunit ribosomal protein L15
MKLHELAPPKGAKTKPKRIGRGPGSGHGKTSGKGHKGLLARSGGGKRPGFEGGQMPLVRRIPKYGFTNFFRVEYSIINLKTLSTLDGTSTISPQTLADAGFLKGRNIRLKVLGVGDVTKPLTIQAHKFSRSAITKIEAAGGKAEVIGSV